MVDKIIIKELLKKKIMEVKTKRIVAGVLIKCIKTGNIFLVLRNDKVPTWALVSGGVEDGENILEALKREVYEELFVNPSDIDFKFIDIEQFPEKNTEFHYYQGFCENEFKPILDHENLKWVWTSKDSLPSPLYKGLIDKINKI